MKKYNSNKNSKSLGKCEKEKWLIFYQTWHLSSQTCSMWRNRHSCCGRRERIMGWLIFRSLKSTSGHAWAERIGVWIIEVVCLRRHVGPSHYPVHSAPSKTCHSCRLKYELWNMNYTFWSEAVHNTWHVVALWRGVTPCTQVPSLVSGNHSFSARPSNALGSKSYSHKRLVQYLIHILEDLNSLVNRTSEYIM